MHDNLPQTQSNGTTHENGVVSYQHSITQTDDIYRIEGEYAGYEDAAARLAHQFYDHETALEVLLNALELYRQRGYDRGMAAILANIGDVYNSRHEHKRAVYYYEEALVLHNELGLFQSVARLTYVLGMLYADDSSEVGDADKAEEYLKRGVVLCRELVLKTYLYECHKALSMLYERRQRWEESLAHYRQFTQIKKDAELEEAKQHAQRFEYECRLAELESRHALELKIKIQEQELMAQTVAFHRQEAENSVRELVEKNNLLNQLHEDISKIMTMKMQEMPEHLEKFREKVKRNINSLENAGSVGKKWAESNRKFTNKLKELYPSLTAMELKIAALMNMNLTTANISSVLFLSLRTVETHRFKIRRKMGLTNKDGIPDVLRKISTELS